MRKTFVQPSGIKPTMSRVATSTSRRLAVSVLAAGALVASTAPAAHAKTEIYRESANGCASAEFTYTYKPDGNGSYSIFVSGEMFWKKSSSTCGAFLSPYVGVLQYKGEQHGIPFGWTIFPSGIMMDNPGTLSAGDLGYTNVRFRMCNMNNQTGYIGTCGSS
ncbi:hypothetical protein [Streptosporangium roseum]|uniref:Uncharacterized protein n=1 Tax=Streptosporangium roseum (strain ATCC 12428 / DSM 43021 / JCM 3005 / KCTC 9067 / NCIMB 10171 / NRRL 2505 / NI 9100) TaxID=479432 RepID=D2AT06_STRRD|nr:hypothetical protein [Streptosporangium roseum]ACZ90483.1 hypothetical protein Sros_7819 [Streptosporangium roseum DSM 43021]